jgi:autotransporter-associated beta strand protein
MRHFVAVLALVLVCALAASPAAAQTEWIGGTSVASRSLWSSTASWTGGVVPNGTGAAAKDESGSNISAYAWLDTNVILTTLKAKSKSTWNITTTNGSYFTFAGVGGTAYIVTEPQGSGTGGFILGVDIVVADGTVLQISEANSSGQAQAINLTGLISGSGSLYVSAQEDDYSKGDIRLSNVNVSGPVTVDGQGLVYIYNIGNNVASVSRTGTGVLMLTTSHGYTGAITADAGRIIVTTNGALGDIAGTTTINDGGSLGFQGNVNYALNEIVLAVGAGNGGVGAVYNVSGSNTFAGSLVLAGSTAIGSEGGQLTISTPIAETVASALTKVGSGTVVLSGSNGFAGPFTVSAGTLVATATNSLGMGGVTVSGGVLKLGLVEAVAAGQQIQSNGGAIVPLANFGLAGVVSQTSTGLISIEQAAYTGAIDSPQMYVGSLTSGTITGGSMTAGGGQYLVGGGGGTLTVDVANYFTGANGLSLGAGSVVLTQDQDFVGNVAVGAGSTLRRLVQPATLAPTTVTIGGTSDNVIQLSDGSFEAQVVGVDSGPNNSLYTFDNAFSVTGSSRILATQTKTGTQYANVQFTGPINLAGALAIGRASGSGSRVTYGGTITVDQSLVGTRVIRFASPDFVDLAGSIVDGAGANSNPLNIHVEQHGQISGSSTFSKGIQITNANNTILTLTSDAQLSGLVTVGGNTRLWLYGANIAGTLNIDGAGAPVVGLYSDYLPKISGTSSGAVVVSVSNWSSANLTSMQQLGYSFFGAGGINYTFDGASLAPAADNVYRFYSNSSGTLIIQNGVLADVSGTQASSVLIGYGGVQGGGTIVLASSNGFSGGVTLQANGGQTATLISRAPGAIGTGPVNVTGTAYTLRFDTAAQTVANSISFAAAGTLSSVQNGNSAMQTTLSGTLSFAPTTTATLNLGGDAQLNVLGYVQATTGTLASRGSLVIWSPSNVSGSAGITVPAGAMGISSTSYANLPAGNVNVNGGVLVFDNLAWSTWAAARPVGTAAGQFQLSSGGLAARGTTLVVNTTNNFFDKNFTLGSINTDASGNLYANAGVDIASPIVLTGNRTISVAGQGPALAGQAGSGVTQRISGGISGAFYPVAGYTGNTPDVNNALAELVLGGSGNSWTGSPTYNNFNFGPGGLQTLRGFLWRIDGNSAMPSGNSGTNVAYIGGIQAYGGGSSPQGDSWGLLLTNHAVTEAKPNGEVYAVGSNYKIVIGGNNDGAGNPQSSSKVGIFGVSSNDGSGGMSTLHSSDVVIVTGSAGKAHTLDVLVRDGSFQLGLSGSAMRFMTAWVINATSSVATPLQAQIAGTSERTLRTYGIGTIILKNVQYVDPTGADFANQFTWQIGPKTAGVFNGAVRETGVDASSSTTANKVVFGGGVLELGGGNLDRSLGTGASQLDMSGAGGGGFAAYGAVRTVNLGGASATVQFGSGNFVGNTSPLIFGSPTANNMIVFQNPVNLNGGTRTIATIAGGNTNTIAELAGDLSNGALTFGTVNTPWGETLAAGRIIVSGALSYTGATTINAGSVIFNGEGVASTNGINVAAGLTVGGSALLNRPMVAGSGVTLIPGYTGIGTLGLTDLSLDSAILNWDLAIGSACDTVLASGILTAAGVSTFNFSGSFGAGTYNLIDYGTFTGTITNFTMSGAAPGALNWLLKDNTDDGIIQLLVFASANEWASTTGGDWNVSGNWTGGVPNAIGAEANFGSNLASADTVNLDIAPTVGAIKFDNANKYTIGGTYTLTLATSSGNASIQVDTGSHEIAAPVTLGSDLAANIAGDLLTISGPIDGPYGVTKTGAGKLEINGTATYTGTTHVVNGELSLGAAQTLGAVVIDSSALVTLTDGATQISSLEIAGGSSAPEAKLDIMSNALIIDYSGSESPLAEIEALIIKGYNGGDWAGNGITSSVLFDITAEAIGVIDNTTFLGGGLGEFAGRSIGMETVLVRKVIAGDIDMSGEVNAADYFYIDFNLDTAGGGWGAGDLDYSGETNSADYFYIDFNLGMSEGASMGTSIPEPATLVLLTLGGLAVVRRRR